MKDSKDVIAEFNEYVNMTASELETWLKSDDSNSAGWPKDNDADGSESVGHDSGRNIVEILKANPDKDPDQYTEQQIQHMRKVASYCKRHLAQEASRNEEKDPEEVKKTKSYASLKNWGHDFLKAQGQQQDSSRAPANGSNGKKETAAKKDDKHTNTNGNADEGGGDDDVDADVQQQEAGAEEQDEDMDEGDDAEYVQEQEEDAEEADGEEEEEEEEDKKAGDKRKKKKAAAGRQNGSNKKRQTRQGTSSSASKKSKKDEDGDEQEEEEEEEEEEQPAKNGSTNGGGQHAENGDGDKHGSGGGGAGKGGPRNGPAKGDTVSWSWGNGNPEGKVLDVKPETATIETKRGNQVTRNGNPDDPAVVLDTGKSTAIKSAHELN